MLLLFAVILVFMVLGVRGSTIWYPEDLQSGGEIAIAGCAGHRRAATPPHGDSASYAFACD